MAVETEAADLDLSDAKRRLLEKMLSGGAARKRQADGVVKRSADDRQPMSLEQQNVWLHSEMAPGQPLYNEPITIHRRGSFALGLMEKSFNEILRRHEAWRTSFQIVQGEAVPVVHDDFSVRLPLVDLTGLPAAGREAEALRLAKEDALTPIDLSALPLFRARVFKLAEDDHRLHLTLHHIIFDGVSLYRIVVPELSAIYDAYACGRTPLLDPPGLQYGDYAIWRERHTSSDSVAKQMDYWRQNLRGPLPMLQLPSDRPRPAVPTYSGSMEKFALSDALSEALKTLSRNEGVTLYMTLLAAFKALLHRYSGQEDIIIGGVTDTRQRPELKNVVGYFLNSLVLRTRPSSQMRFREFLAQAGDAVVGALSASEVPFDRIVREVQPKRDLGAHPLFQVLFSVQPPAPVLAEGWDLTQMDVAAGTAKFDLYLELEERADGIIGRFLYSTDLFDAPTIRRMIGHWRTILEAIVADPDCLLERLPLLTKNETQQLLTQWNNTAAPIPRATIHQLFEDQAARSPHATAIECDGKSLTYLELNRRANALANRLREQGAASGTLVAICVERSIDMLAGLLAILKTGSAYLPLDPGFPQQRLAMILENAQPALLLTQPSLAELLPKSDAKIVLCDGADNGGAVNGPTVPPTHMSSQDIAYVIYTSGSTGTPKGVEIPHHAAVNLLSSMKQAPGCSAGDALLAVTTISFDIAALELFMPLLAGGRVIVATKDDVADPRRLVGLIERSQCTIMQATPATWRALIEAGWSGKKGLKVLCGGESLPRELADRLLDRAGEVWNMYGPTETTVWSTTHKVARAGRSVPIGRPIANTRIYILDARGNPVPVGVTGELCIGGDGVARGYHKRDDLTRERFVTVAAAPGERIYRTGDLARYRSDGTIECLGRNDQQVKIRGFRVELEEIEAALAKHPALASVALKAWPDPSGELALCAYGVKRGGNAPDVAELRQFLRQSLPDYMIPSHYVWMAALPTTPNAKVDRNALAKPDQTGPRLAFVAPRNDVERKLADIWKQVLQVESVGVTDNFFDLGGHSLLFARLVRRLEEAFSMRLSMSSVFQASSLESMAALLANPWSGAKRSRATVLQANGSQPPFFWLSEPHAALSLVAEIGPGQPFITVALDLAEKQELSDAPRLADIGSRLVKLIRTEQPHGPYFIGGYCTSGIVAFEVASQLVAAGCEVGLVVMLHSANPVFFGWRQKLALELDRLKHGLRKTLSLPRREKWRTLTERLLWNGRRLLNEGRKPEDEANAFDEVQDRAAYVYVPKQYPGTVALLQPAKRPRALDYRSAWAGLVTGKFIAVDISGSHATLMERPHVSELGAKISACLREAQESRRPAPRLAG
jgi:amino acid adenylation domain-containing protein